MKLFILISTALLLGLVSCSNNQTVTTNPSDNQPTTNFNLNCLNALKNAQHCDSILLVATSFSKIDAENAVTAFTIFASTCKDDSLAPVFLLKAGQVAQSLGKFTQAMDCFNKCINIYDKFKNRGVAMFLLAQLFDDSKMLNNEEEAKKIYEEITKQYPKSEWAINAELCIKNLGKTDEELMKEFINKNK